MSALHAFAEPYHFARTSRSRSVALVALLCLGFIVFGLAFAAPWYTLLPAGLAGLECLNRLLRNTPYGFVIDSTGIRVRAGRVDRHITHAEIDHVRITDWSDSTDIAVVLDDGTQHPVPAMACPASSVLETELKRRGIRVERR